MQHGAQRGAKPQALILWSRVNGTHKGPVIRILLRAVVCFSFITGIISFSSLPFGPRDSKNCVVMEESLERKQAKRAHHGVVTKYVQEVNTFPEVLDTTTSC